MKKGFSKMFMWLFIGLLLTFGMGYLLSIYPISLVKVSTGMSGIVLMLLEIGIAVFFSARLNKMSELTAKICYLLYCVLTGITFGLIFLIYDVMNIITVFLVTSLVFGIFALIGYTTKKNLSKMSMWLFMSLLAVMIFGILNIFIGSSMLELVISVLFILIFLGYVVFDMKNAEALIEYVGEEKGAIYGAFQLYLDFINLFLELLRFLGKFKDN